MPILLLLVCGLVQYGLWFMAYQSGSDTVRSAARLSAVGSPASCSDLTRNVVSELGGTGSAITVQRTFVQHDDDPAVTIGDDVHLLLRFNSTDLHMPFVPFVENGKVEVEAVARVEYLNNGTLAECR